MKSFIIFPEGEMNEKSIEGYDQAHDEGVREEREAICKLCCAKCENPGSYVLKKNAEGYWGHYGTITRDIIPCASQAIRQRGSK